MDTEGHTPPSGDDNSTGSEATDTDTTVSCRSKHTHAERDVMDAEDLDDAIASAPTTPAYATIRKHIIARAKALGLSSKIPDAWNADGSKTESKSQINRRKRGPRPRAVPLGHEVRFFSPTRVEVRSEQDSPNITITGEAIVYGTAYRVVDMFGEFRETIHAGAAADLLGRGVDCRLLFNHGGLPMARTTSGTMTLIDDPDALRFVAKLDARQQLANDFAIAVERQDLSQMSIGMLVGNDKWGEDGDGETRDIFALADLQDISGVTYPCSATTHIEVAKRMAFAMPLESRARLRRMEVELRAGKVLSANSQSKLVAALSALHDLASASGVDPVTLGPNADEDGDEGQGHEDGSEGTGGNAESDAGIVYPDGTGQRNAPATEAERREQSLSYGDQQSAVYQAILAHYGGDETYDLWICDMGDDWVVWESYADPVGMFRCSYNIDASDDSVTLVGDPEPVARVTTYEPSPASSALSDTGEQRDEEHDDVPLPLKASTLRLMVEAGRSPTD